MGKAVGGAVGAEVTGELVGADVAGESVGAGVGAEVTGEFVGAAVVGELVGGGVCPGIGLFVGAEVLGELVGAEVLGAFVGGGVAPGAGLFVGFGVAITAWSFWKEAQWEPILHAKYSAYTPLPELSSGSEVIVNCVGDVDPISVAPVKSQLLYLIRSAILYTLWVPVHVKVRTVPLVTVIPASEPIEGRQFTATSTLATGF